MSLPGTYLRVSLRNGDFPSACIPRYKGATEEHRSVQALKRKNSMLVLYGVDKNCRYTYKLGLRSIHTHVYMYIHTEAAAGLAPKLNAAPVGACPKANVLDEEELAPNANAGALFASSLAGGAPKIPAVDAAPPVVDEPNEKAGAGRGLASSLGGGAPKMLAVDTLPAVDVPLAAPQLMLLVLLLTLSSLLPALSPSPNVNFGAGRVGNAAKDGGTTKSMASGSEKVYLLAEGADACCEFVP